MNSNISMILYFWINDIVEGRMGAKSDVMIDIFDKLKENNIKINEECSQLVLKKKESIHLILRTVSPTMVIVRKYI
ncbi:MAG: hypothetical protein EBY80_15080 [Actinobacteria bacterium]|nr:hypothetical protein [Actinomycetota bacterium]